MSTHTVEIYVSWNENGDAEASTDRDTACSDLENNHGGEHRRVAVVSVVLPALVDLQASVTVQAGREVEVTATDAS